MNRRIRPDARGARVLVLLAIACASCRGACHRDRQPARPLGGRLALFPLETRTVVSLDVAQVRASPLAARLSALAVASPGDEKSLQVFHQRTGLDPVRDIDSVTVAFPEEARARGELGVILRASRFDQSRLVAYVRDALQKDGDDLVPTPHGRRLLWAGGKDPTLGGFFLDDQTLVIGGGGWATRMVDLADVADDLVDPAARPGQRAASGDAGVSAESDIELLELCERAAAGHAIWAAAIVPPDLRRQLARDPRFAGAAAVMRMSLAIELGAGDAGAQAGAGDAGGDAGLDLGVPLGLDVTFTAELADAREATALVGKVTETLREAKRDPRVLMLGLGPDLDGVTSKAEGATFTVRVTLGNAQVSDLLQRAGAFLTLARQGRAPGF
jgi:hypothetical protein